MQSTNECGYLDNYPDSSHMVSGQKGLGMVCQPRPWFSWKIGDGALAVLMEKLLVRPPKLGELIIMVEGSETILDFYDLVRNFLPEYEIEIMNQPNNELKLFKFAEFFGENYFPLEFEASEDSEEDMDMFTRYIPVYCQGLGYDDYDALCSGDGSPEIVVAASLIVPPYEDHEALVAVQENLCEAYKDVNKELLPARGWSPQELHTWLDGSKWEGLAWYADWFHENTNSIILNTNYDYYSGEITWSRELVQSLTEEQEYIREYARQTNRFGDLVDPRHGSGPVNELLEFIDERRKQCRKPIALPSTLFQEYIEQLSVMTWESTLTH